MEQFKSILLAYRTIDLEILDESYVIFILINQYLIIVTNI